MEESGFHISKSPPRRRRPPLSCTECRRRKLKCDRMLPCGQCVRSKTADSCVYVGMQPDAKSTGNVSTSTIRHDISPPASAMRSSGNRTPPTRTGLYVFDSKPKASSDRITKPGRPDELHELHELRNRIQALEQALSRSNTLHTPESSGSDACSAIGARMRSDNQVILDPRVEHLPEQCFRGKVNKTRFFGRCHWTLDVSSFQDIANFLKDVKSRPKGAEYSSMKRFKSDLWSQEKHDHQRAFREQAFRLEELLPPRELADQLLHLYLSTFETTYRILHVPTFLKQYEAYWAGFPTTDTVFVAKLLALMAASNCFLDPTTKVNGKTSLPKAALGWIMAVQSWIASIVVSSTIDFDMLQLQCLLIIARQASANDGDMVWISSGSVIRSAVMMGLHRDPYRFPNMTRFWAEMRRRLWATMLELDIQSSLDSGIPPSIDPEECDCGAPSNVDDDDLTETTNEDPIPQGPGAFTRSTFQSILLKSLPIRLRIAKLINSLHFNLIYDDALRLSDELVRYIHDSPTLFQNTASTPGTQSATFAHSLYIFLLRRYLLALHRPFSLSVVRSPQFSYSRKLCLEGSLEILSLLEPLPLQPTTPQLAHLSGGMFRDEFFHAAMTVCVELALQADEYAGSRSTLALPYPLAPLSDMIRSQQEIMLRAVERTIDAFAHRIGPSGKGCKTFLFLNMVLASVKARLKGETNPLKRVEEVSVRAVRDCRELLSGKSWTQVKDSLETTALDGLQPPPVPGFDSASFLAADMTGFSPLNFENLFDMSEYGIPDLWGNNDILP